MDGAVGGLHRVHEVPLQEPGEGLAAAEEPDIAVVSYTVRQRKWELGIRVALGAGQGRVIGQTLREPLLPTAIGAGIGMLCGAVVGRILRALLFGVAGFDPLSFVGGPAVIMGIAALAPSWRAAAIDPAVPLLGDAAILALWGHPVVRTRADRRGPGEDDRAAGADARR